MLSGATPLKKDFRRAVPGANRRLKPTVRTGHSGPRSSTQAAIFFKFVFSNAERLFDKDMLARAQCGRWTKSACRLCRVAMKTTDVAASLKISVVSVVANSNPAR